LPGFLIGRAGADEQQEVIDGLILTGHFLERHVFAATHAPLPEARLRVVEAYRRLHTRSGITAT
jgi:DNA repair protein RecO (recombination protein O)